MPAGAAWAAASPGQLLRPGKCAGPCLRSGLTRTLPPVLSKLPASIGPVPSPYRDDAAGLSGTLIAQASRGAIKLWRPGSQPSQNATPHPHLRCRRRTSAHTVQGPVAGPASQRTGPGSPRRCPAAAGRRHRNRLISPSLRTGGPVGSKTFLADASPRPIDPGFAADAGFVSKLVLVVPVRIGTARWCFGPPYGSPRSRPSAVQSTGAVSITWATLRRRRVGCHNLPPQWRRRRAARPRLGCRESGPARPVRGDARRVAGQSGRRAVQVATSA
jgi:hypothetical protein